MAAVAFFAASCNKYLDIRPKGITIPEYYDDYVRLMNNQSMMYAESNYPLYITDDVLMGGEDVEYGDYNDATDYVKNLYSFAHGAIFGSGATDDYYESAYKRIYTFNTVINNVGTCKDGSEADINGLIAEARMARAFEYLSLVNAYSKVYDSETASSDLGVPLMVSEDIGKEYERVSVKRIYDFIMEDLSYAERYIPDEAANRFRASKLALYLLQTKLYLYLGEWGKALESAEKMDMDKLEFLDYKRYSINPDKQGAFGKIWDAETGESYPYPEDNIEGIYTKYGYNLSLSRNVYASESLLATFDKDLPAGAVDQRRALFFSDDEYTLYNKTTYFPGKTMYTAYISQNCGPGTPEFYLLYAEACIRNGDIEGGVNLINVLRDNRIINNVHIPSEGMSKERALELLFDERRREFAFIGAYRLFDMKRLMAEGTYTEDIVHVVNGQEVRMPANDNRLILPIPPKVLAQNPDIPQYER